MPPRIRQIVIVGILAALLTELHRHSLLSYFICRAGKNFSEFFLKYVKTGDGRSSEYTAGRVSLRPRAGRRKKRPLCRRMYSSPLSNPA